MQIIEVLQIFFNDDFAVLFDKATAIAQRWSVGLVIERLLTPGRTANAPLRPWERHITLISHCDQAVYRCGSPA